MVAINIKLCISISKTKFQFNQEDRSNALLMLGIDPIWLGIMIAINLQTSFLTPPFGFALFYLRGVAPDTVSTQAIYRGVIPFILIQIALLITLAIFPELVTALPNAVYG